MYRNVIDLFHTQYHLQGVYKLYELSLINLQYGSKLELRLVLIF